MYTEQDVLDNFKNDMLKLSDTSLPYLPKRGDLKLDEIANSKYIFS